MSYTDFYHANKSANGIALRLDVGLLNDDVSNVFDGFFANENPETLKSYEDKGMSIYKCSINKENILSSRNLKKTPQNMEILKSICNVDDGNILDMFSDFIFLGRSNVVDLEAFIDVIPTKADYTPNATKAGKLNFLKHEIIRLKGRIAAKLGYDGIKMTIKGQTLVLIVNPLIEWQYVEKKVAQAA
ncbi:hypothetical protein [Vibrio parahaemolyticus]|uniref:hypothetical protein n=1 Tax=Vibrio parahaemolyticus TaxID=670 RepID=UPI0006C705E2|nr:hypothetical protein ACX10_15345 [Vibrio parahaemolyticus]